MQVPHNDLHGLETSTLQCMIDAFNADHRRLLTPEEIIKRKNLISLFQREIDSRHETGSNTVLVKQKNQTEALSKSL